MTRAGSAGDLSQRLAESEQRALGVEPVGDLFERHRQRGIELRIVSDLQGGRRPAFGEAIPGSSATKSRLPWR
jgi:hypothetical protein